MTSQRHRANSRERRFRCNCFGSHDSSSGAAAAATERAYHARNRWSQQWRWPHFDTGTYVPLAQTRRIDGSGAAAPISYSPRLRHRTARRIFEDATEPNSQSPINEPRTWFYGSWFWISYEIYAGNWSLFGKHYFTWAQIWFHEPIIMLWLFSQSAESKASNNWSARFSRVNEVEYNMACGLLGCSSSRQRS